MTQPSEIPEHHIVWTREKLARLIKTHAEAVRTGQAEFDFEGNHFVTAYAKYLIEYLTGRFK